MKTILLLILLLLAKGASAQTPYVWRLGIYDPTISNQALGTLQVNGRIFPAGTALSALSSDADVAVVGRLYAGADAQNASGILNSVCLEDQAMYSELTQTPDDLQAGSDFLQPFTSRIVPAVAIFGKYSVVFVKISGPNTTPLLRYYAIKHVNGLGCISRDEDSDLVYLTFVELMMNYL
jgi:hypothetical protein